MPETDESGCDSPNFESKRKKIIHYVYDSYGRPLQETHITEEVPKTEKPKVEYLSIKSVPYDEADDFIKAGYQPLSKDHAYAKHVVMVLTQESSDEAIEYLVNEAEKEDEINE
jgi:hypothetical protein